MNKKILICGLLIAGALLIFTYINRENEIVEGTKVKIEPLPENFITGVWGYRTEQYKIDFTFFGERNSTIRFENGTTIPGIYDFYPENATLVVAYDWDVARWDYNGIVKRIDEDTVFFNGLTLYRL
jgi:hypothetical protein